MKWTMLDPALLISERLKALSDQKLPHEILRINDETSTIILDIGGHDYALTMIEVPNQRERPTAQ